MNTPANQQLKTADFLWLRVPKGKETRFISIRSIGWFSLLKLLVVGFSCGSLPFVVLLNLATLFFPSGVSEEVKNYISLPAVLWCWPVAVLFAAWFTNFFVAVGVRLFGMFVPLRIKILVDTNKEAIRATDDGRRTAVSDDNRSAGRK